jgi:hypothetical protein
VVAHEGHITFVLRYHEIFRRPCVEQSVRSDGLGRGDWRAPRTGHPAASRHSAEALHASLATLCRASQSTPASRWRDGAICVRKNTCVPMRREARAVAWWIRFRASR